MKLSTMDFVNAVSFATIARFRKVDNITMKEDAPTNHKYYTPTLFRIYAI